MTSLYWIGTRISTDHWDLKLEDVQYLYRFFNQMHLLFWCRHVYQVSFTVTCFSISAWTNIWMNSRVAGALGRHNFILTPLMCLFHWQMRYRNHCAESKLRWFHISFHFIVFLAIHTIRNLFLTINLGWIFWWWRYIWTWTKLSWYLWNTVLRMQNMYRRAPIEIQGLLSWQQWSSLIPQISRKGWMCFTNDFHT